MKERKKSSLPVFNRDQVEDGKKYREEWYKNRNHEMVFPWHRLSEEQQNQWITDAIEGYDRTEGAA